MIMVDSVNSVSRFSVKTLKVHFGERRSVHFPAANLGPGGPSTETLRKKIQQKAAS
jgi:hypothetical protein